VDVGELRARYPSTRARRDVANERLTPEEIHYKDGGVFTIGCDKLRRAMSVVLAQAPADVVEDLMDNCLMLMPEIEGLGEYIPASLLENKALILLPEQLLDRDWAVIESTILHEVAHFRLRHTHPLLDPDLDYDAQERETDALVEQWLSEAQEEETK